MCLWTIAGERDYACDICGATYVTGTDLRRHRLKHDEVKPYPCQLCDKQFTRSHDLKVSLCHLKDNSNKNHKMMIIFKMLIMILMM